MACSSPLPEDSLSDIFVEPAPPHTTAALDHEHLEPKRATFAMAISVEVDKKTGKTQVISTASITPDTMQEKGLKVYEDSRKSVYALPPDGTVGEELTEMTPTDVEELLRQATDWKGDVQYHQPVYAAPFTGTSRPSTPRTSSKTASPNLGHGFVTPNPGSSRAGSRLEVYPEIEESTRDSVKATDNLNDSPYAVLGAIKTSNNSASSTKQVHENVETSPGQAKKRYRSNILGKSVNLNTTSTFSVQSSVDKFGQSVTPSPTRIEEYQEELDLIPQKTSQNSQTVYCIDDLSDVASEEMSASRQSPCDRIETRSLLSTHRYEMDLIKRSMNKSDILSANFTEETMIGCKEIVKDMTPNPTPSPNLSDRKVQSNRLPTKDSRHNTENQKAELVSIRASLDGIPTPTQLIYKNAETCPPSPQKYVLNTTESILDRTSPSYSDSLANSFLEELDPGAVTMIFMGYEKVDEDEDEDPIQAELVVIGNSDEEDSNEEDGMSVYHPNGYTSKVFQPVVAVAKVTSERGSGEELQWSETLKHKPTFRHRSGKSALCLKQKTLQGSDEENVGRCVTDR